MIIDSTQYNGMCACGREHKMETVLSVVECGCLREFDRYASQLGIQGCRTAVYDENTYRATADRHPTADHEIVLSPVNLHADEHGVDLLMEKLPEDTEILRTKGASVPKMAIDAISIRRALFIAFMGSPLKLQKSAWNRFAEKHTLDFSG